LESEMTEPGGSFPRSLLTFSRKSSLGLGWNALGI